jgi:hypothetical protein
MTYIQGTDVLISMRANYLRVLSQSMSDPYYYVQLAGGFITGDVITTTPDLNPANTVSYTVQDGDNAANVIAGIVAAVNGLMLGYTASSDGDFGFKYTGGPATTGTTTVTIEYQTVACTKSDVLNVENEFLEKTPTQRKNTDYLPTFQGMTMSIEQAVVVDVTSLQADTSALETWAFNQELIAYEYSRPDGSSGTRVISGYCYIKSFSESGGVNTGALANFEMLCVGEPTISNI